MRKTIATCWKAKNNFAIHSDKKNAAIAAFFIVHLYTVTALF